MTTSTPTAALDAATPTTDRTERWAWLSGTAVGVSYLAATAFVLVFFATSHPPMDAAPTEAARGFRDAGPMVAVGTWLTVLPLPFALVFLGGLASVLRRISGDVLATAAVTAGAMTFGVTAVGALVSAVTPTIGGLATDEAAGAVVKALDGVMPLAVALSGFPRAVLVLATVLALSGAGTAGRGLRTSGYAVAALGLVGTAAIVVPGAFPVAALSMLLFIAWISVLSVGLLRSSGRRPQGAQRAGGSSS